MSDAGLSLQLAQAVPIPLAAELRCAPGELVALVGPSGSGKTTILRAIAGLYRAANGHIACNGEVWFDSERRRNLSPQTRRVGLVFQDYALFPHLTALDNVICALGHRPRGQRTERARELLERVHLGGLEQRRPGQLSGGQRQRVAVARALARDPSVLLLDEPFSAVDQVTRRRLQRELVQLRRTIRVPMILVTHDLEEALTLADRICVLYHGRTLQAARPQELLLRPADAQVARLMDQSNLFRGRVHSHQTERNLTLLRWGERLLEARHAPHWPPGSTVDWLIPASHIVLHRRGRPSRGERENPVHGVIVEQLLLGETTAVTLQVDDAPQQVLNFSLPSHAAERNGLAIGARIGVSLLAEGIHLMPPVDEC